MDIFSILYKTRVSFGIPGIIYNAAEPIPDFFQELSTKLPQPAQSVQTSSSYTIEKWS